MLRRSLKGGLCAGLILLEFNVRLGDPEAQVLSMRLMSDVLPAPIAARERVLKSVDLRWHAEHAVCVVMTATPARHRDPRSHRRIGGMAGFFMVIRGGQA